MERKAFQETIEKLNKKLKAKHLEHDVTISQLEQLKELSMTLKKEVRIKLHYLHLV